APTGALFHKRSLLNLTFNTHLYSNNNLFSANSTHPICIELPLFRRKRMVPIQAKGMLMTIEMMRFHAGKPARTIRLAISVAATILAMTASPKASSQTWTPLAHPQNFLADTALLLTDGTVMIHQYISGSWWKLTPDLSGNYINGSLTSIAAMPPNYGP